MPFFLASYGPSVSEARAGVIAGTRLYDAAALLGLPQPFSMLELLARWTELEPRIERASAQAGSSGVSSWDVASSNLLAPILYPGQIFGAGANYVDHVAEMVRADPRNAMPDLKEIGEEPWHYIKGSRSCVVGPGSAVPLPAYSNAVDWEIELAVVIGRTARNVPVADALDYVAGYTIANDVSVRDSSSRRQKLPTSSPFYRDWIASKAFEGACPLGPWIVPASQIPDPQHLGLRLWVSDELMQDSNTSFMSFTVAEQLATLSERLTLHPGDVILTGTPAGVGAGRNRFLRSGDTLRLAIEGIGELRHTIA
jgi:2-keto-4-pentenoate hydratase/2-oxohepta-3-ene-1,7-dioic acid hydratase in catechol pathway